jgi:hypothetical protein
MEKQLKQHAADPFMQVFRKQYTYIPKAQVQDLDYR